MLGGLKAGQTGGIAELADIDLGLADRGASLGDRLQGLFSWAA
ncbi:MAG: hypothetical protein R2864_04235 [Syntrophotaleaceae bacterium]